MWAKYHAYPFEILLAVVPETNHHPIVLVSPANLVLRTCVKALVAAGLRRVKNVVIYTLGMPTRKTGRDSKQLKAILMFLETNGRSLQEQLHILV